jgi:hypothetical protein
MIETVDLPVDLPAKRSDLQEQPLRHHTTLTSSRNVHVFLEHLLTAVLGRREHFLGRITEKVTKIVGVL